MQGEISLTDYSAHDPRTGRCTNHYEGQFILKRRGEQWSVNISNIGERYSAECLFDGVSLYTLYKNLPVTTLGRKAGTTNLNVRPEPLAHLEAGRFHSDAVNAIVTEGQQPNCIEQFITAAWIGTIPNGANVNEWRDPVIIPWSAPLGPGISRFQAKPKYSHRLSDIFPEELEFVAAKESSEFRQGARKWRFGGIPEDFNPFPPGTVVGNLRVLSFTNIAATAVPSSWVIQRFWLNYETRPTNYSAVAMDYWIRGVVSTASFAPLSIATPSGIAFVADSRLKTNELSAVVMYSITNEGFLPTNDPKFAALFAQQAGAYVKNISSSAVGAGSRTLLRILIITLCVGPLAFWVFSTNRDRNRRH